MRRSPSMTLSFIVLLSLLCTEKTAIAQSNEIIDDASAYHDTQDSETCVNRRECPSSIDDRHDNAPPDPRTSRHCPSLPSHSLTSQTSLLQPFYNVGMSAQAYKPNAPVKRQVCEASTGGRVKNKVARNPIWRTTYRESVPIIIRGSIYSCGSNKSDSMSMSHEGRLRNAFMEVWQPRPDGTYSSLRNGIQDGDCRATVLITTDSITSSNFELGHFVIETLSPGSTGVFGGLVPSPSSFLFGEYPPYSPGKIHFFISVPGYYPLLAELGMNDVGKILSSDAHGGSIARDIGSRFRFFGGDWRPHGSVVDNDENAIGGGMELQSATIDGSLLEVEIDFFLVPMSYGEGIRNGMTDKRLRLRDIFCSPGYFGWMPSFFKEPISVCFSSLLDYFAL
ncbi:hypothetical protein HJC23_011132 [Cyclotella cryptica]|uniref:Uncharacterized protein n=1 Tax=Cyclotella cryptica TaxID=29204 RepID=A0ABD3P221_9STRA